ncbi:MAG TPA: hypothetical protein VJ301_18845 [Propionibacteriaceae bacterium]|nr:hypothetical protein [Propionibacteriaceae bacterium]
MTTDVATSETGSELLERVVIGGDLSKLAAPDRLRYYREVCASTGLNPLTKPFEYIHLNGKLTLYARRDATDQLRKLHGVSIQIIAREQHGDVYAVVSRATGKDGRTDEAIGAVATAGLKGEMLANALMKAETKSKRRVTLSICGLGMLDETEVETIPNTRMVPLEESSEERKQETPTESSDPPASSQDWCRAFRETHSISAHLALWNVVIQPDVWRAFTQAERTQITKAKDDGKVRLGAA